MLTVVNKSKLDGLLGMRSSPFSILFFFIYTDLDERMLASLESLKVISRSAVRFGSLSYIIRKVSDPLTPC